MDRNCCVYCHINKINSKRYFGFTSMKPERRWRNGNGYLNKNPDGSYTQPAFAKAILKYTFDGFEHIIVAEGLSEQEAKQMEIDLIAEYNTTDRRYGYNISTGGESASGFKHSEETKKMFSETRKGEGNSFYGKHHTEKSRMLISEAKKIENLSMETRLKMSKNHADVSGENNPMYGKRGKEAPWYGKHHSEETKRKMSESKLGYKHPFSKRVMQLDKNTDDVINCFDSTREAERETGINNSSIIRVCNKKQNTAGGYKWQYI